MSVEVDNIFPTDVTGLLVRRLFHVGLRVLVHVGNHLSTNFARPVVVPLSSASCLLMRMHIHVLDNFSTHFTSLRLRRLNVVSLQVFMHVANRFSANSARPYVRPLILMRQLVSMHICDILSANIAGLTLSRPSLSLVNHLVFVHVADKFSADFARPKARPRSAVCQVVLPQIDNGLPADVASLKTSRSSST